jgi:hypothetical protein
MMKKILLILIFLPMIGFGQTRSFEEIPEKLIKNFDKMGVNDDAYLNSFESDYFNFIFQDRRGEFDFTGKKVGFIMASNPNSSKSDYFNSEKSRFEGSSTPVSSYSYLFNESEKDISNGYDGVIAYWFKFILTNESVIQRLKEKESKNKSKKTNK